VCRVGWCGAEEERASSLGSRLSGVVSRDFTLACTAISVSLSPPRPTSRRPAQLPNRRAWNAPRCRFGAALLSGTALELLEAALFWPCGHPPHLSTPRGRDRRTRWAVRNEELSGPDLVLASTRI
jgi:hypothetical protein